MPKGVYQHKPRSEETKKKISIAHKGKKKPYAGKSLTEQGREKISKGRTGIKASEEARKKMSLNHRRYQSIEARKKMSLARKGKTGELASNWRGGITPINTRIRNSIDFRLWREAVFARDNWICQKCKKQGIYLEAHHIKSFAKHPELRFAIDNGKTLCKDCHKEIHFGFYKQKIKDLED